MAKIYLSAPATSSEGAGTAVQMKPKDFQEHGKLGDLYNVLVGKREVEADPEKLKEQICGHIAVVQEAVKQSQSSKSSLKISSVKLGLTVTVGGNVGLASAEAEASIEIVFSG